MSGIRRSPVFANEDWLLQQQLRAEIEADSWRRLREMLAAPAPAPAAPSVPQPTAPPAASPAPQRRADATEAIERGGSIILKALVRFGLGVFGAYLAWIAAMDGRLGEFEVWLATGSGFLVVLAASMFEPLRRFVHILAETLRFALLGGVAFGVVWAILQFSPGPV